MENKQTLWYTRKNGVIKGPFTSAIISNNLILGRLRMTDEVSQDQMQWQILRNIPELQLTSEREARVKASKHLDERSGFDRRQISEATKHQSIQRQDNDRRRIEPEEELAHRQFHTLLMQKIRNQKQHVFWPMMTLFSVLFIASILAIMYPSELPTPLPNCNTEAGPNVNWNNCLKPKSDLQNRDLTKIQIRNSQLAGSNLMNTKLIGADLAYADLRFTNLSYSQLQDAILLGADLKQSDLSNANLTNVDLSFADLRDSNLGGSILKNTRLSHTIWFNGQLCSESSIDQCEVVNATKP